MTSVCGIGSSSFNRLIIPSFTQKFSDPWLIAFDYSIVTLPNARSSVGSAPLARDPPGRKLNARFPATRKLYEHQASSPEKSLLKHGFLATNNCSLSRGSSCMCLPVYCSAPQFNDYNWLQFSTFPCGEDRPSATLDRLTTLTVFYLIDFSVCLFIMW